MARGYKTKRKTRRPRRRRRRKNNKKKYSVSVSKLASKKIDTLLERRMVEISQAQLKTLVNRKWITDAPGGLRNATPTFGREGENYSSHPYTYITSTPFVSEWIDVVKASDINLPLNVVDPENPDNAGVTRGMITETAHGYRSGNSIKIKGISLDIRIISDFGLELLSNIENNQALEITKRMFSITRGQIILDYKVVLVKVSNVNQALPSGDEVAILALKYNNFGYSPALDVELKEVERTYTYKTIMSGKINCSPGLSFSKIGHDTAPQAPPPDYDPTVNIQPYFREFKQYKKFPNPIQIDYAPTDQNGKAKTKQAIYFVAKSNFDASNVNAPIDRSCCPQIAVISKMYYYD